MRKGENLGGVIIPNFVVPSTPQDIAQEVYRPFYHYYPSSPMHASALAVLPLVTLEKSLLYYVLSTTNCLPSKFMPIAYNNAF
jgi:hypothetical protein